MFTGNENHDISLHDAAELTKRYRENQTGNFIKGEFYGKTDLMTVLNQPLCVGLRIYYGQRADNSRALVIVGVDAQENDLTNGKILDFGTACPPVCSVDNPLNSGQ